MPGRMEFQFMLPKSAPTPKPRDTDAPLRILIMADFSGRSHQPSPAPSAELANRPLLAVDVDNFNAVMARLSPKLALPLGVEGMAIPISFNQIDDFHPDALYQRLELFQALRHSRARLSNPASFAAAVNELCPPPMVDSAQSAPTAAPEGDSALLERLLGRAPATPTATPRSQPSASGLTAIQGLLQAAVQAHIVHTDSRQPAWVAAVDAAIGDQMRAILHQSAFQSLEATWRGLQGLIASLDTDAVRVFLLDVTQQELLDDLYAAEGSLPATAIYGRLIDRGVRAAGGEPWSVLVGDYRFGAGVEDIALLAAMGSLAAHAGGPFLAAVDPTVLGCDSAEKLADPSRWTPLPSPIEQNWQQLRASVVAPWLGLALPRILLRLPYGRKADPVESFSFEEMPGGRDPSAYLWGNPAWVCARLIATAFAENGRDFSPGDVLELDDCPAHIYEEDGERVMQPATEALLGERAMSAILENGVMPLLGQRQRNVARLARFQSLAAPPTALAGVWQG